MTLNYIYSKVNEASKLLLSIDTNTQDKRQRGRNQANLNKSYVLLDELKKQILIEHKKQIAAKEGR
jgi:hypothetical protein